MHFCVFSSDRIGFVMSKLVLLRSVFQIQSQEIGWEERLGNDLFCADMDVTQLDGCYYVILHSSDVSVVATSGER